MCVRVCVRARARASSIALTAPPGALATPIKPNQFYASKTQTIFDALKRLGTPTPTRPLALMAPSRALATPVKRIIIMRS